MPQQSHQDEKQLIKDLEDSESLAFVREFKNCIEIAKDWKKRAIQTGSEDSFSNALIQYGCNPNLFSNALIQYGCNPNLTQKIKDTNLRKRAEICLNHYK